MTEAVALPDRWTSTPLRYHPEQSRLWNSPARFCVIEAGRRSGKTELAKRKGVKLWTYSPVETGLEDYFVGFFAPTRPQVKDVYWAHVKAMVPNECVRRIYETDLTIKHVAGPELSCVGMDKPQRAEGRPIDWAGIDEFANMKPDAWPIHLRPALDTPGRPGQAWIYGVPRPSVVFAELAERAQNDTTGAWDYFTWPSADILTPQQIEDARRDLDERSFEQEYNAKRVPFSGRAYYAFDRSVHAAEPLPYDPQAPLVLCFDFNVDPGAAVICQEITHARHGRVTAVIGEVHIKRDSNTPRVCQKIVQDWGGHRGEVYYYGDPTGGNRGTAKLAGNDWDLVYGALRTPFSGRLFDRVDRRLKDERLRVNAVNARLLNALGEVRLLVDPARAPTLVRDFENVVVTPGSAGALDKTTDKQLTHWADALGYYVEAAFPLHEHRFGVEPI